MAESQLDLEKDRVKVVDRLKQMLPDVMAAESSVTEAVFKDGALSTRVKRLIALAIALGAGCRNCQLAQTTYALKAGATKDEILETISVVLSMRGTTGVGESLRVIQLLEELNKL